MQFWAVILIVYLAGAFVLRDDFWILFLQPNGAWWVAIIAVGLIAAAFAGAIRNLVSYFLDDRQTSFFALLVLFCIGGVEFLYTENNNTATFTSNENAALAYVPNESYINRSWDGHFRAIAQIGEADVGLMVDTGASIVLIRHDDALRIGLDPDTLEYTTPMTTASGKSFVAPVTLESLSIGGVTVYNVKAAVAQQGALHSSLLGMSFLENLEETVIQKNRMVLRK